MSFFKKITTIFQQNHEVGKSLDVRSINIPSDYLGRGVRVDIFTPPQYLTEKKAFFPIVLFNDGQDMTTLGMHATLTDLFLHDKVKPFITVGIHCSDDRINEYGTQSQPDYKGRGAKAKPYNDFIMNELLPFLRSEYRCKTAAEDMVFAGFSLGALSALDIAWSNEGVFGKVGVFSGSLWWRSRDWQEHDPDGGRIMHDMVAHSTRREGLKFWFEVGTRDEESDRNNNGIIDAIDDTLDLINCLVAIGYRPHEDIKYVEIEGGEHNPHTWGKIMPDFLIWAFGK